MNYPLNSGINPNGIPVTDPVFQQINQREWGRRMDEFEIVRFLITETGSYNNQVIRPYHIDVRPDTINQLLNATSDPTLTTSAAMAPIANQIMRPSPIVEGISNIVNGWGERRCRYILEVKYTTGGLMIHEIINGYSDHLGLSATGQMDPNMRFFVNSITTVSQTPTMTSAGNILVPRITANTQVLADPSFRPVNVTGNATMMMRPRDVFENMRYADQSGQAMIASSYVRPDPSYSRRSNNIASKFLSNVVNAYTTSAMGMNGTAGMTDESILDDATGMVNEQSMKSSGFMMKLHASHASGSASFTMRDLMQLDPAVDYKKRVVMAKPVERAQLHQAGQTANWDDATAETLAANTITQAAPAIMMEYGLSRVKFMSTNHTTGQPVTNILEARSFSDSQTTGGIQRSAEAFKHRLMTETINDLTFNNNLSYYIEASFDLNGESHIRIAINSQSVYDYVVPSFTDSLSSSILTNNQQTMLNNSIGLHTMLNNLVYNYNQNEINSMVAPQPVVPTAPATRPATTSTLANQYNITS